MNNGVVKLSNVDNNIKSIDSILESKGLVEDQTNSNYNNAVKAILNDDLESVKTICAVADLRIVYDIIGTHIDVCWTKPTVDIESSDSLYTVDDSKEVSDRIRETIFDAVISSVCSKNSYAINSTACIHIKDYLREHLDDSDSDFLDINDFVSTLLSSGRLYRIFGFMTISFKHSYGMLRVIGKPSDSKLYYYKKLVTVDQ